MPPMRAAALYKADKYLASDNTKNIVKKIIYILAASIVLFSYILKLLHIYTIPS